jgi:membrane fusion protein
MDNSKTGMLSLRKGRVTPETVQPVFRAACIESAQRKLPGRACVITPPTARVALLVSLLAILLIAAAAWLIEIPQRISGAGVLMPPGGLLKITATGPGHVAELFVAEGDAVESRQPLLKITSDTTSTNNKSVADLQIASLRKELVALERANRTELEINGNQQHTLGLKHASAEEILRLLSGELMIQTSRTSLIDERGRRLQTLEKKGSIPLDQYQQHQMQSLQAMVALSTVQQRIGQQRLTMQGYRRQQQDVAAARVLLASKFDINREKLIRAIHDAETRAARLVPSPETAVIARVAVKHGATVRAGQTLVTLFRPDELLQAWLYISSARARKLESGHSLQIRLDAFPHRKYGLLEATVISVSRTSLLSSELDIPLGIRGPVFEIRAVLDRRSLDLSGLAQHLRPGLTFQADLLFRRYRLYEWIFQTLFTGEPGDADPATA